MTESTRDLLDRPEVLGVLFHPRREPGIPQLSAGVYTVRLEVEENVSVGGKIFAAAPGAPVIIFFHGNGEIAADYAPIAPLFRRLGLTLFVIDYRGYGMSDGRPTSTALLRDAWAAYQRAGEVLAARGITAERVYLMGRSLGSAAVLEIAARQSENIAGLIIESGFARTFALIERLGGIRLPHAREDRDGFGNLAKIAGVHLPTLIIHGEEDFIIPVEDGRDLYDASPAEEKHLITVPGAGHNDLMLIGRDTYFAAIAQFCGVSTTP
jgi:alpha-beta hydrolase superfamily lysophospholipase